MSQRVVEMDGEANEQAKRAAAHMAAAQTGRGPGGAHKDEAVVAALLAIERRLAWLGEVLATAWDDGRG